MTYDQWLAALDENVMRQIERYANPPADEKLGFLYDDVLANELAAFYAADGAVETFLGDIDIGPSRDSLERRREAKKLLDGQPRGAWLRLLASYPGGTIIQFAMATGGVTPHDQSSGDRDWTYASARARMLERETYDARRRCDAVREERADALHAGQWPVGTILKNIRVQFSTFSTCTVTQVEPREITLSAKKRGSPKIWTLRMPPRALAAKIAEAAAA